MPIFSYIAFEHNNNRLKGLVEASTLGGAAAILHERGLFVVKLKEQGNALTYLISLVSIKRVTFGEVVNFTRQLSTMITAGLPITRALSILEKQTDNQKMKEVIRVLLQQIEGGSSIASAVMKFPNLFSAIYIALLRAGEAAGVLDKVLERLADTMEKTREFRGKIKNALIYPIIIVIGMGALIFIMMIFVVPQLAELYKGLGVELPFTTRMIIRTSDFFVSFWWLIILSIVGVIVGFKKWKTTPRGKRVVDYITLHLPIIGNLQRKIILTEFTRTLGILIGAGVPMLEALRIVYDSVNNVYYEEGLSVVMDKVQKGSSLSDAIEENPLFPPIISQMIAVGEQTGKMDDTLQKVSHYYEIETDEAVKALTTAIEPIIMVVLGVGVLILVYSIISPIYKLTDAIH